MERYRHKIKTPEELRAIIGPPPREKRVIMCHGVFDVVHPGHVRHLLYAKSKADLLVAGVDHVFTNDLRDYFVGLQLRFTDDDLKTILPFAGGAVSGASK